MQIVHSSIREPKAKKSEKELLVDMAYRWAKQDYFPQLARRFQKSKQQSNS